MKVQHSGPILTPCSRERMRYTDRMDRLSDGKQEEMRIGGVACHAPRLSHSDTFFFHIRTSSLILLDVPVDEGTEES